MQGNWIVDGWRSSRSGHAFTVDAGDGARATYARSSDADVVDALERLADAEARWRRSSERERSTRIASVAEHLARSPDPERKLARRLGLDADEGDALERRLASELEVVLPRTRTPSGEPGTVVVRCDWSELGPCLARAALAHVAEGRSVLVLSDRAAPMLAEGLAHALEATLEEHGGAPLPVAVLHDDGSASLQRAAIDPRVVGLAISAPSAPLREIERWLNRSQHASRANPLHVSSAHALPHRFGAGLDEPIRPSSAGRGPARALRVLRNESRLVQRGDDVVRAAREVVDAAFGRVTALSGQAPKALGRVLCHERALSRFTAALLDELARSHDAARPLALLDPALVEHQRRAVELGLDEGATPIFTARDAGRDAGGERKDAAIHPVVFTNVEEHMRLAWLGRPAPLLCLLRVESDARAEELAAELDRDPLAEDLSGAEDRVEPEGDAARAIPASTEASGETARATRRDEERRFRVDARSASARSGRADARSVGADARSDSMDHEVPAARVR